MAFIVSAANGLFSNASTWRVCDTAGSRFGNVTTATALSTSNTNTTAFTASTNTQVDGVALRINLRGSGTPANTLRVWLRCHSNTTDIAWCNVSVSDIPFATSALQNGGWVFFKFGSAVTLASGNSYSIVCNLNSTNTTVSIQSSNATALASAQLLRSTTAQAPAAGDDIFVFGEMDGSTNPATVLTRLVTMDNTANTDFGSDVNESFNREALSVSKNGILRWGGPTAGDPPAVATNYYLLLSGSLTVFNGGQLDIGTIANPIPRDSSAIIDFDTAASKQYGLYGRVGSIINIQGLSRTSGFDVVTCNLISNVSAGNTTVLTDQETGWLNGDEVVLAPTTRTYTDWDFVSLSGNANAAGFTVNTALGFDHLGTSPYYCEVLLLSRNIKLRAANTARASFVSLYVDSNTNVDWCQFESTPVALTISSAAVNATFDYCSFTTPGNTGNMFAVSGVTSDAFALRDSVFYGYGRASTFVTLPALTTTNWRVSNCYAVGASSTAYAFVSEAGIIDNIYAAGIGSSSTTAISLADTNAFVAQQGNTANLYAHSCGQGVTFAGGPRFGGLHNIVAWRNNSGGVNWGPAQPYQHYINRKLVIFAWGNGTYNLQLAGAFVNCAVNGSMAGETSFATTDGIKRVASGTTYHCPVEISFDGMSLGVASGANVAHANNDVNWTASTYEKAQLYFKNCLFGSANEVGGFTTSGYGSSLHVSRRDQTSGGAHYSYYNNRGQITCNTTVFRTAAPSEQLTPTVVSPESKLPSGIKRVAVASGATANVSVYLRKDTLYSGSAPRLMQRANPAIGVTSETVLATAALANADTWYLVSGTTAAVIDDGVLEVYVDCDGTTGSIFIDDWSVA